MLVFVASHFSQYVLKIFDCFTIEFCLFHPNLKMKPELLTYSYLIASKEIQIRYSNLRLRPVLKNLPLQLSSFPNFHNQFTFWTDHLYWLRLSITTTIVEKSILILWSILERKVLKWRRFYHVARFHWPSFYPDFHLARPYLLSNYFQALAPYFWQTLQSWVCLHFPFSSPFRPAFN